MNISVGDLLDIFFKNLGTIATAAIVALIASVSICVFAPVSYKSSAMILVKPGQYRIGCYDDGCVFRAPGAENKFAGGGFAQP